LKPKSLLELVGIARRFEQRSARLTAWRTFSAISRKRLPPPRKWCFCREPLL